MPTNESTRATTAPTNPPEQLEAAAVDLSAIDINNDGHFQSLLGSMHPLSKQCVITTVNDWGRALLSASATTQAAEGEDTKPIDCSSDPSNCPDNEGYGCHCSASAPDDAKGNV